MTQHQTAALNAWLRLFALPEAQGPPASEADDLEAGAFAGAQCEVVELDGMAPALQGSLFPDGWDDGVSASDKARVHADDRIWVQHGSRAAPVHGPAVRRSRPSRGALARTP
ncbi:hypothetical protein [Streptomyces sp. c-19]|uniref:hypothetical protein n=1 Tax=Streptomyces sp. c-19 TaxID=2789275 RepID=UPI003980026F